MKDNAIRIGFFIVVTAAALLIISIAAAILMQTVWGFEIMWSKIGWLVAGTGVLITPPFLFKAVQKKYELKYKEDEKTSDR